MNPSVSFSFSPLLLILLLLFLSSFFPTRAVDDDQDNPFSNCKPIDCGKNKRISYPFRERNQPDYCGHSQGFVLDCESKTDRLLWNIMPQSFLVLEIDQSARILKIARIDIWDSICPETHSNATLNSTLFNYTRKDINTTLLYNCHNSPDSLTDDRVITFRCPAKTASLNGFFVPGTDLGSYKLSSSICEVSVVVPVLEDALKGLTIKEPNISKVLQHGFEVEWNTMDEEKCGACIDSGGRCGHNSSTDKFTCLCPDDHKAYGSRCGAPASLVYPPQIPDPPQMPNAQEHSSRRDWKLKTGIGIGSGFCALLLICIIICCRRCTKSIKSWTKNDQDLEAFIKSYGHLTAKRYRFFEVKKMTKSFKHKLGQGGFGEVYKGKLLDGRHVAVKILNASKGNGEEFINEVASISRTSHVNIVTLLGFCLDGRKRALIYEFMPNGSLEKFTYKDNPSQTTPHLEWGKQLQICIGIARGLEYLHRGCNTKILHLDIKPHNILLDEDLCPKIADFGLAKLCPRKESIISMAGARGTIGYIAPEVVSRNFGGVSSKSDVYSYGMMILEMVGGRKNIKVGVSHTSEIYFPDWIYKHLKQGSNLQLWRDMTSEENEIARKMILVGLWCIQTKSSDRPSMTKVIEMLEGSVEALHLPPNPSMFSPYSPERLPLEPFPESSTTSML